MPKLWKSLAIKGGIKISVVYLMVCRHEEKLVISSSVDEKVFVVEMPQTEVVLVVAALCLYALLLEDSEDVAVFQVLLGNSDVVTESAHCFHYA